MLSYLLAALESEEDKRRFTELYEENHVRAEQTALRILRDPHDAEDAVQNAFLQVIHHFDEISEIPCKKLGFWIISIVKNEALMILSVARQFFCETRTEFLRKNSPVLRSKSETRSLASTAPKTEGAAHVKGRVLAWGGAAFAAPPLAFCPRGSSYPSVASPASSAASWAATGSVYSDQP